MTRAWVLVGLTMLLASAVAHAEGDDTEKALAAAAKVRAALPGPSPIVSLKYEGDIVMEGLWAGEITLSLKAAKVGRKLVWRATERSFTDWKGIETRRSTILHLSQDLSVISGSAELRREDETTALVISRTEKGFFVQRRAKKGDDWKAPEMLEMTAPRDATHGLAALLLLLRSVPADDTTARYALPRVRWPFEGEPKPVENVVLGVEGKQSFGIKKKRPSWAVKLRLGDDSRVLHFAPDRMALLGSKDTTRDLQMVPRGEGGERNKLSARSPAKTWQDAFLKFGYGYHQARRKLLDAAFHWERFYEHETKVLKRWDASRSVEDFKQAWIDEFCGQSKHRSDANTKRLLDMTLSTGKVTKKTKDSLVFAAHANFGGGTQRTYYLEKRDDVWGIVRIEFK